MIGKRRKVLFRPCAPAPVPEGIWQFGEEYRPVTLQTKVLGYDAAKNDFLFEKRLNDRLYEVVMNHFCSKPTIVFCDSRDGCVAAAKEIANKAAMARYNPFLRDDNHRRQLSQAAGRTSNKALQQTIPLGVAFHSSALVRGKKRASNVRCCTNPTCLPTSPHSLGVLFYFSKVSRKVGR